MPRQPRLDARPPQLSESDVGQAPGLLQHVMARGIERRKLFRDDKDRQSFLDRLAVILEETQTQCYAWALIPNHFHLLLRTGPSASADASGCRAGPTPLSKVMRRLMTGYAVTFNKRHTCPPLAALQALAGGNARAISSKTDLPAMLRKASQAGTNPSSVKKTRTSWN